jgi:hypothetical protein
MPQLLPVVLVTVSTFTLPNPVLHGTMDYHSANHLVLKLPLFHKLQTAAVVVHGTMVCPGQTVTSCGRPMYHRWLLLVQTAWVLAM